MKTPDTAKALARSLVRVGRLAGMKVSAVLTEMDAPLGRTIGNALETAEAISVLHGGGPDDVREVTFALGAEMLRLAGLATSKAKAMRQIQSVIDDGSALTKMRALVEAQGGDPRVVDEPDRLPKAKHRATVVAPRGGYVRKLDALDLGVASMKLGAGRTQAEDDVDPTAGLVLHVERGERVTKGQPLATLHASSRARLGQTAPHVLSSFDLGSSRPRPAQRIIEVLRR